MEACGAVEIVTAMYNIGLGYIAKLCTDDDSSTHANVWPSYKELVINEIWKNKSKNWPKTKRGCIYVEDHGKHPLYVPFIEEFLADQMQELCL